MFHCFCALSRCPYTTHCIFVFWILLKISQIMLLTPVLITLQCLPALHLILAKIIIMAYKASFIWLCDFSDFTSYFFPVSECPRFLGVSHCDRNTHASGSLKWLFRPSDRFFPRLTSLGCNSYLRYSYITHSLTSFRALLRYILNESFPDQLFKIVNHSFFYSSNIPHFHSQHYFSSEYFSCDHMMYSFIY